MWIYYLHYSKSQGFINNLKLKVNPLILRLEIVANGGRGSDPVGDLESRRAHLEDPLKTSVLNLHEQKGKLAGCQDQHAFSGCQKTPLTPA